jgi:hypothetical protein
MYSNEMSENLLHSNNWLQLSWFSSNISNYIHAMICCNDSVINSKVILMNDYVFSNGGWVYQGAVKHGQGNGYGAPDL